MIELSHAEDGVANEYIDKIFEALWVSGLNLNDQAIIDRVLKNLGVNPKTFALRLSNQNLKDELKNLNTYLTNIKSTQNEFNPKQINELFYNGDSLLFDLEKFSVINLTAEKNEKLNVFNIVPQPAFNKKFDLLVENLISYKKKEYSIFAPINSTHT